MTRRAPSTWKLTALLALAGTAASQEPSSPLPDHLVGAGPLHKVVVPKGSDGLLLALRAAGAVSVELDCGAYHLLTLDDGVLGGPAALADGGLEVRDEWNRMVFDGLVLDGLRPEEGLSQLSGDGRVGGPAGDQLDPAAGLYLVQFAGPVRDEWLLKLEPLAASFRQYVAMHGYVLQVAPERLDALGALRAEPAVQYVGAYQPEHRLTAGLRRAARDLPGPILSVTVQLTDGDEIRAARDEVAALAALELGHARVGSYVNLSLDVDPARLFEIASHPRVFAVEPRGTPVRRDEVQGQIVAGNVAGSAPSAPGYLSWLASRGFDSSQFGSFSVNVVDDAPSLTGHPDLPAGRVEFALNPSGQSGSQGGHGFLNAHIVAGFNDGTGAAVEDAGGYNYGLGIAPWAHVGSTAIFGPGGSNPSSYESDAYGSGARISSNSWGFIDQFQNPIPDYDSNAQQYDFISRDAQSGAPGNQEFLVLFAAGNDGPGDNTVSTPGTAKNVLTVGASENVRATGTDGCGVDNGGADDAGDVIGFSSHGPVNSTGGDGRWKPEIVAPGTHVQAGVPQSSYTGSSVCNQYWPSGQTLYGWSSGTSHSTPAGAGWAALVRQWFLNSGMGAPSPALTKAVLVATGEYLTGSFANDTLPSNSQGMGRMQLERPFGGAASMTVDQSEVLRSTGAEYQLAGSVADPAAPFRVTLAWTDAPGPTTGAPWVNDLDLTVDVGGALHRGNVFSGAGSTPGGSADFRNNTESVFLPPGTSGAFTVTVTASSVAGDGVPGNGDATDQDFGLYVYNATPDGAFAQFSGAPTSGVTPLSVDFTDLSLGDVSSWSWDFGDTGTSTEQNPTHVYTSAGAYTVSLTIDGVEGTDTETKVDYVVVSDPPPPGLGDGSFESQTAGSVPAAPWGVAFGAGHVVSPSGVASDGGMPSQGAQWCEIAADSTNGATPPSNPGGAGSPPAGAAGISQTFTYPPGQTELRFEAAFLRNEEAGATYNDFMSVDVTDGSTTYNVYYKDVHSPTTGTSAKYGYAMTPVETVIVDLLALFPSSTPSTQLTLTALVGNGVDDFQPSKGYVDDFRHVGDPAPAAEFSGTPTVGTAPVEVAFSDLSTGGPTSWSWELGDGALSSDQNPVHTYDFPGSYDVTLTVANASGADAETKVGYVTAAFPPQVGASYGSTSPGSLGVPLLDGFRSSAPGSPLYLRVSSVPPGTPTFVAVSTSPQTPALDLSNGFLLNVGIPIALVAPFTAGADGEVVMKLGLGPAIQGISLFCQGITADGTGGDLFASSQGLQVAL